MSHQPAAGDEQGLLPVRQRQAARVAALAGVAVLLVAVGLWLWLPREVATGRTADGGEWSVHVVPGLLTPTVRAELDGARAGARLGRPFAGLQATALSAGPPGPDRPSVLAGSAPARAGSVSVRAEHRVVREAELRWLGWHHVHVTVFDGPVEVVEVVAIGSGGQILDVLDGRDVQEAPVPGPG